MSKGKLLVVSVIWLLVIAGLAAGWRFIVAPTLSGRLVDDTGSTSQYAHRVTIALDSFSGYAILRSPEYRKCLAEKKIRLELKDDGADYFERIKQLDRGRCDMAVFTIDALVKVSDQLGKTPATIVAVIDETRGADAMVAYQSQYPNVDSLNRKDTRFVLTPDSPSETLARVIMAQYNLDQLPMQPFIPVADAQEVHRRFRTASQDDPHVYVLWEPFVSKTRQNANTTVLASTEQIRGYIVDVLVANRKFLVENPEVVQQILGCYFRTAYDFRGNMAELVYDDSRRTKNPLSEEEADSVVNGIRWRNTQENFAHMGLLENESLELVEDMITKITRVLEETGAIEADPTGGSPEDLYFNQSLAGLQNSKFYPGLADEEIREDKVVLPALSDSDWENLREHGTFKVPPLVFARGTSRLTSRSQLILDRLKTGLESSPQYYLAVRGNASRKGNLQANTALARSRAEAVVEYLIQAGIDKQRVRAESGEPTGEMSVTFVLGQPPY